MEMALATEGNHLIATFPCCMQRYTVFAFCPMHTHTQKEMGSVLRGSTPGRTAAG